MKMDLKLSVSAVKCVPYCSSFCDNWNMTHCFLKWMICHLCQLGWLFGKCMIFVNVFTETWCGPIVSVWCKNSVTCQKFSIFCMIRVIQFWYNGLNLKWVATAIMKLQKYELDVLWALYFVKLFWHTGLPANKELLIQSNFRCWVQMILH